MSLQQAVSPLKVLIVEDDQILCQYVSEIARARGHQVTACPDAESAWAAYQEQGHELLVVDWILPGMQGDEFIRRVRASPRSRESTILMLTVKKELDDLEIALDAGADDYLFKPVSEADLTTRFRVLENRVQKHNAFLAAEAEVLQAQARLLAKERELHDLVAQLKEANRDLTEFSYTISHDLRAPLRAISGFSGMLREDFREQLPETAQNYLDRIQNSTATMSRMIDGLLGMAKFACAPVRRTPLSLAQLVKEVLADNAMLIEAHAASVRVSPVPDCEGDPVLLRQVCENLIGNALKYTSKCKDAQIDFGAIQKDDAPVVYYVRDNGVGFDMKYSDKLFSMFQRLHSSSEFEGDGIGLANVRRIIERHDGRVWAEAAPDAGATFFFTLARDNTATAA